MYTRDTRRWWALGALSLALLVVGLDVTVLSVALPALATALHASEADLQWFAASYSLALVVLMLPAGLLGDRYGRKKMLLGALVIFGGASLLAAFASSPTIFIVSRTVLGAAAAFMIPLSLSVLTVLFTEEERPKAVGIWSAANFLALPIGPIFGGWLLTQFWWGSVFLINIPVVLLSVVAVVYLVPESHNPEIHGLDLVGVVTSCLGLAALVYGIIEIGENGWSDMGALVFVLAGCVVLVGFAFWEWRLSRNAGAGIGTAIEPLVDVGLFRSASFTWGTILMSLGVFAMFGVLFAAPQYFQAVMGVDAQGSGFRLLPMIAGFVIGAATADRVSTWLGTRLAVTAGFGLLASGLALGATTTVASGDGFLVTWTGLVGLGMALAMVTAANGALGALSAERSGVGSGLIQAVNKLGSPFSAAVIGSILSSVYRSHLELGALTGQAAEVVQKSVFGGLAVAQQVRSAALLESVRAAFVAGMDAALWGSTAIAVVAGLLAAVFLPGANRAKAAGGEREGEALELDHESAA